MIWFAVLGGAALCFAVKLAGLSVPASLLPRPRLQRVAALVPVVLLAALSLRGTFSSGHHLVVDVRAAGLGVALLALWVRASFLAVVAPACATTALVHAFGRARPGVHDHVAVSCAGSVGRKRVHLGAPGLAVGMDRSDDVETRLYPWIDALRRSLDELHATVEPLSADELTRPSYDANWSIADVLSHLGSQADIFTVLLEAGLSRHAPPGPDHFPAIWAAWDEKDPAQRAADSLAANDALLGRFASLGAHEQQHFELEAFGMQLDAPGLARLRLGELAVHTWDVAVSFDVEATIVPDAVDLLVDTLEPLASRVGKPEQSRWRAVVSTSDPERRFVLEVAEAVALGTGAIDPGLPELRLPAEGFVRLVYGRLDPDHTPPCDASGIDLDDVRAVFPGF